MVPRLLFHNRLRRTDVNAAAAIGAFFGVNDIALRSFGNSATGAGALARAAIEAFVGDGVRHKKK